MTEGAELDRKLIRSSAWIALSSGGTQVVTFLVMILLARLLTPHEFGVVALAVVPLAALGYLQESGLGAAVIIHRSDLRQAAGTQLVFAFCGSLVLYAASFAGAPLLAHVFSQPELTKVFRVMALVLVLRALAGAPAALIERELAFDRRAKGELFGTLVQAIVSVALALSGAGVWSLVAGQLASQAAQLVAVWVLAPFRPSPTDARWATLRELGKFGRHVTASNILGLVTDNADNAVIGRLLGATSVGLYNLAWRLANLPAIEIAFIVSRVTFPVYSTVREDVAAFRTVFRATVRRIAFLAVPVSIGILIAAKPLVLAVFGERWSGAVAPLQILAVFGIVRSISGVTGSVFQAAHRPQLNYQIGVWHAAVLFGMLYALAPAHGVTGVAWAEVVAAVSSLIPSYYFTLRMLELPLRDLAADLFKPAVAALAVAAPLLLARSQISSLSPIVLLLVLVAIGVAAYAVSLATIGRSELRTVVGAFRPPRPADS